MKPINEWEFAQILTELKTLVGGRLQEFGIKQNMLAFGFFKEGKLNCLMLELDTHRPFLGRMRQIAWKEYKEQKPLGLFIRAHFVGRRLKAIHHLNEFGRVMQLHFTEAPGEPPSILEWRIFPHGQNASAQASGKSVAFFPPVELAERPESEKSAEPMRSWQEIEAEWQDLKSSKKEVLANIGQKGTDIAKKETALAKMQGDLQRKSNGRFREVGLELKTRGEFVVSEWLHKKWDDGESWLNYIDQSLSFSENLQRCFQKAKDDDRKIAAAKARIAKVQAEIDLLRSGEQPVKKPKQGSLLNQAVAKGRSLQLSDDISVFVGKSARDNLALLRKAQPHDIWLHLADMPSAHAIVRRNKARILSDAELNQAGLWFVQQCYKKSVRELAGQRFELILAECRFVRPIKGDAVGRVQYQQERRISVHFEKSKN